MIRKLLEKWSCKHKWELYHRNKVYGSENSEIPIKIIDTLICKECGKIKKITH